MICKECNKELIRQKRLHFINNNWYFIDTFICPTHGTAIFQKDIIDSNIVIPNNTLCKHISYGLHVYIVLKKDQSTGKLTEGYVKDILTNSQEHWRGIKVRLLDGQIGRIQKIVP